MAAGSTYTPIATTTLSSAASSITFSSISGSYTDLIVIANGKTVTDNAGYWLRVNNDSSSNYSYTILRGNGTSALSSRGSNQTELPIGFYSSNDQNDTLIVNLNNYSNSSTYKTLLVRGNITKYDVEATVGLWRSTSAINRVDVICASGNLASGFTATIYGITAA